MSHRTARFALMTLIAMATACDHAEDSSISDDEALEFRARGNGDGDGGDDDDCNDFATATIAKSFKDNGQFHTLHDWVGESFSGGSEEWQAAYDEHLVDRTASIMESDFQAGVETEEFCATTCDAQGLGWTGSVCVIAVDLAHDEPTARVGFMEQPVWQTNVEAVAEVACGCG